ncbi:MAG: 4-hydroxy-tetrahydrodipicolinate synthase [Tissierellia bacterium]|nr:4-hydroxy-tetrahydrodipicolinate synthase [Tissierellia bacterium]
MLFKGSGVAIVTPFDENNQVDYAAYKELLEFQIENGTDAIIAIGTTGEASTMTEEERLETVRFAVETVAGRIPVIAGTGTNNTAASVAFSQKVEKLGVDGLLVVTPYYNKTSKRGLYEHFKAIANAVKTPIILYTVPGRTGVHIPVDTLVELAKIENIVGLKDATGNLSYTVEVSRRVPEGFAIYSGNDDVVIPLMSVGGVGVISVLANCAPKQSHDMCAAFLAGDVQRAMELQLQLKPLIDALFVETNPIPVKAAVNMLGYRAGTVRLPLYEAEDGTKEKLRAELSALGIL